MESRRPLTADSPLIVALAAALGLPRHTTAFTLRAAVGEPVEVTATFHATDAPDAINTRAADELLTRRYEVVERQDPPAEGAQPAGHSHDVVPTLSDLLRAPVPGLPVGLPGWVPGDHVLWRSPHLLHLLSAGDLLHVNMAPAAHRLETLDHVLRRAAEGDRSSAPTIVERLRAGSAQAAAGRVECRFTFATLPRTAPPQVPETGNTPSGAAKGESAAVHVVRIPVQDSTDPRGFSVVNWQIDAHMMARLQLGDALSFDVQASSEEEPRTVRYAWRDLPPDLQRRFPMAETDGTCDPMEAVRRLSGGVS